MWNSPPRNVTPDQSTREYCKRFFFFYVVYKSVCLYKTISQGVSIGQSLRSAFYAAGLKSYVYDYVSRGASSKRNWETLQSNKYKEKAITVFIILREDSHRKKEDHRPKCLDKFIKLFTKRQKKKKRKLLETGTEEIREVW